MDFIKNLAVNWTAGNPVLPDEVFGVETDTNRVKLGDGTTRWNSLSYFGEGGVVTLPAVGTLTTGSNAIDLTNAYGKEYHPYDMASGALTLTVAPGSIERGKAYFICIGNESTLPNLNAFTPNPKSDIFDPTNGNRNLIEFEVISGIFFYNITCLDI